MTAARRPDTATRYGRQAASPPFDYVATGVPDAVESYARAKVARLYRLVPGRVLYARVTVTPLAGRATGRHCAARGALDVGGHIVRAGVEAVDPYEAVDLLQQRLRDQVVRLNERRRERRPADAVRAPAGDEGGRVA
jgi:ribosome-associated translation inhibitor RaiA